jgi:hypothetical protein
LTGRHAKCIVNIEKLKKHEENEKIRQEQRIRMKEKMKEFYENRKKIIKEG